MIYESRFQFAALAATAALLAACASAPPPAQPAPTSAPTMPAADAPAYTADGRIADPKLPPPKHRWSAATEAEVAAELDQKFQEAAKQFVQLKKDGKLMFCKKYREIGSNIATIHCITEAQLRTQVENIMEYKERMRTAAKCTHGVGCQAGF